MRSDLKIGILVGALLVVGLIAYFMSRGGEATEPDNIPVGNNVANPDDGTPPALVGDGASDQEQGATMAGAEVTPPNDEQTPPPEVVTPPEEQTITPPEQQIPPPVVDNNDERQPRFYIVQEGDSLSGISMSYYADEKFALVIQKVNADKIKNANTLQTGWRIRIPYPDEANQIWIDR